MEQNIQKPSLPIKTKIAAWWMMIFGGLETIAALCSFLFFPTTLFIDYLWKSGRVLYGLLFIISGYLLIVKRKKIGWWLAEIILFLSLYIRESISTLLFRFVFSFPDLLYVYGTFVSNVIMFLYLISIIFLILLLLDRKNFWKIAK